MSRLMEYINEVDKNAHMRAAHQLNPTDSMSEFGLTIEECNAVLSGSGRQFAEVAGLGQDFGAKLQSTHIPQGFFLEK